MPESMPDIGSAVAFVAKTALHWPDQAKLKWSFTTVNHWIIIRNPNGNTFMGILINYRTLAEIGILLVLPASLTGFAHKCNS